MSIDTKHIITDLGFKNKIHELEHEQDDSVLISNRNMPTPTNDVKEVSHAFPIQKFTGEPTDATVSLSAQEQSLHIHQ